MAATNAVEGYCTSTERAELVSEFFLIGDPKGNVTLRVTDFAPVVAWTGAMPAAVVGVDLAESSDPRQRSLGRDRLEEMLA
ncbi:MAG: hypothetical protein LBJ44_05050 [Propionibacteriaceae bacterium]|nr:hypothetical protein [Propionibacteriaceae bacterium]